MPSVADGHLRAHSGTFVFETLFLNKLDSIVVIGYQSFKDSIFLASMPFPSCLHLPTSQDDFSRPEGYNLNTLAIKNPGENGRCPQKTL